MAQCEGRNMLSAPIKISTQDSCVLTQKKPHLIVNVTQGAEAALDCVDLSFGISTNKTVHRPFFPALHYCLLFRHSALRRVTPPAATRSERSNQV